MSQRFRKYPNLYLGVVSAVVIASIFLWKAWADDGCSSFGWDSMHGACIPIRAFFVESAPPEDKAETIPSSPSDNPDAWYWVKGHWDYYYYVSNPKSGKWIWTKGSWVKRVLTHEEYIALGEHEQWEPERWEVTSGGWALRGGHVSKLMELTERHYADIPPPADKAEARPPLPNDNKNFPPEKWYWSKGQWYWINDRYQWAPGQWMVKPGDFYRWVPARWEEHRGQDWRGWLLLKGFIEYKTPDGRITADCCSWVKR